MGQLVPATRRVTCGSEAGAGAHLVAGERSCAWCESVQARRAVLGERLIRVPEPSVEDLLERMVRVVDEALHSPPDADRVVA